MRIQGTHTVAAPRAATWHALHDVEVLARALPGCESFTPAGEDTYAATVTSALASLRGTYRCTVVVSEVEAMNAYRLVASGAGEPGTVEVEARVVLDAQGSSTLVHYDAEATVGGRLSRIGGQLVEAAAARTADAFFAALDAELAGHRGTGSGPAEDGERSEASGASTTVPTADGEDTGLTAELGVAAGRRIGAVVAAGLVGALLGVGATVLARRIAGR